MSRTGGKSDVRMGGVTVRRLAESVLRSRTTRALLRTTPVRSLRGSLRWRSHHARWLKTDARLRLHDGSVMYPLESRTPRQATAGNAEIVLRTLDELDIPYTEVRHAALIRTIVGVPAVYRRQLLNALGSRFADEAVYCNVVAERVPPEGDADEPTALTTGPLGGRRRPLSAVDSAGVDTAVLRVWRFYFDHESGLEYGPKYGCEIEFWQESDDDANRWRAPRPNVAGEVFSSSDVALLPRKRLAADAPRSVFDLKMINDIDFPIDVVYPWVDSADPKWREKLEKYSGKIAHDEFHKEASGEQRFRSRDELKFSLRSLTMYAPWVRHVYIVTDGQVPEFVDFDSEGITLVDHRDITTSPEALPVFNSSPIISWLHRIPGLSEHYIYMNDDVFFGRDSSPSRFFTASGLARVFPSKNRRPFGAANPADEPHFNITRNVRSLLEEEFGRSISQSVKHTPHAQLVSVHNEIEKRFPNEYERTSRSRFRHHDDVASDQIFHYYAQMTGRAVVGSIRYAYINIGDRRREPELRSLLQKRSREVFCLNDAPADDIEPMSDSTVRGFLEAYFPIPSRWERR